MNGSLTFNNEIEVAINGNRSTFSVDCDVDCDDIVDQLYENFSSRDVQDFIVDLDNRAADIEFSCGLMRKLGDNLINEYKGDKGERLEKLLQEFLALAEDESSELPAPKPVSTGDELDPEPTMGLEAKANTSAPAF